MKYLKYFLVIVENFLIILGVYFLIQKLLWEDLHINIFNVLLISVVTAPISKIAIDKVMGKYILKKAIK